MTDFVMCIIICPFSPHSVRNTLLITVFVYARTENGSMWVGFALGELLPAEKKPNIFLNKTHKKQWH